jgi:DNA-binding MarR family transcriptional regulator
VAVERTDVGYLLALASRRWNEILEQRFSEAGFPEVRASYGALLVPLFEEDGLRMTELARRARLSKQTLTTMTRLLERDGLVTRRPDPHDARAARIQLTKRARRFQPVVERVLGELDATLTHNLGKRRSAELKQSLALLTEFARDSLSPESPEGVRFGEADDGTRTHDLLHGKQTL